MREASTPWPALRSLQPRGVRERRSAGTISLSLRLCLDTVSPGLCNENTGFSCHFQALLKHPANGVSSPNDEAQAEEELPKSRTKGKKEETRCKEEEKRKKK